MSTQLIRDVAVIGSGMAGLTAALRLGEAGVRCSIFDKSRGPGGRMSSKRVGAVSVDLGAQFFTQRNPRFTAFLKAYAGFGTFATWDGKFCFEAQSGTLEPFHQADRYVGVPRMSALTRGLAEAVQAQAGGSIRSHYETRIEQVQYLDERWYLTADAQTQFGPFDALIVTAPPAQAEALLRHIPAVADAVGGYAMQPCWALGCRFEAPLPIGFDAVRCQHPVLEWAARDTSKPGRDPGQEWWVLHAQPEWSRTHRDASPNDVIEAMTAAFSCRFAPGVAPVQTLAHRWLYARLENHTGPGHLAFDRYALGICGDWLSGGRVEGAFESADGLVTAWPLLR